MTTNKKIDILNSMVEDRTTPRDREVVIAGILLDIRDLLVDALSQEEEKCGVAADRKYGTVGFCQNPLGRCPIHDFMPAPVEEEVSPESGERCKKKLFEEELFELEQQLDIPYKDRFYKTKAVPPTTEGSMEVRDRMAESVYQVDLHRVWKIVRELLAQAKKEERESLKEKLLERVGHTYSRTDSLEVIKEVLS